MSHLTDAQVSQAFQMKSQGFSSRKIAEEVIGRSTAKSTINDLFARMEFGMSHEGPKIAFIDVESQGTVALTHGRFKTNISPKAVISEPYMLSYAVNWAHEPEDNVECLGLHHLPSWEVDHRDDLMLMENLWQVLDDADIVIAHNTSFDNQIINARFAYWGIQPPSSYQMVCTLKSLRKHFRLPANSLDAATRYFNLERKLDNAGIELWLRCYYGDEDAMDDMCAYNKGDIPTLRQLYYRILPFIKGHPNASHYYDDNQVRCRKCGSSSVVEIEGNYEYTAVSKFKTFRCESCGGVQRERKSLHTKDKSSIIQV